MGAGLYDDGFTVPRREFNAAAEGLPAPVPVPSAAAWRRRKILDDLRYSWLSDYCIAVCDLGGVETWTAAREDGTAHFTAGDAAALARMLRHDVTDVPRPRPPRDYLLERLRARHSPAGWVIVCCDGGLLAVRGTQVLGPHQQAVMAAELGQERHEDARWTAGLRDAQLPSARRP